MKRFISGNPKIFIKNFSESPYRLNFAIKRFSEPANCPLFIIITINKQMIAFGKGTNVLHITKYNL